MNPVLLALVLAASPSTKLGVYVAGDDATSRALLAGPGCPAVATFAVTSTTIPAAQVSAFRSVCPMSRIVAQVGDPGMSIVGGTLDAEWPTWSTLLGMVGWVNLDAVEGPSEPQGAAADLQSFWTGFAVDVQQNGKVPVVGSLATGTTSSAFCPTASAIAALGKSWTWSYHAFSTGLTESLATESATTFGYRAIRDGCGLAGIPIYVTQADRATLEQRRHHLAGLARRPAGRRFRSRGRRALRGRRRRPLALADRDAARCLPTEPDPVRRRHARRRERRRPERRRRVVRWHRAQRASGELPEDRLRHHRRRRRARRAAPGTCAHTAPCVSSPSPHEARRALSRPLPSTSLGRKWRGPVAGGTVSGRRWMPGRHTRGGAARSRGQPAPPAHG